MTNILKQTPDNLPKLTKREVEVLVLAKDMLINSEIAEILCISSHTVKAHIASAIHKLGAKNRFHAVIIAAKLGYFEL